MLLENIHFRSCELPFKCPCFADARRLSVPQCSVEDVLSKGRTDTKKFSEYFQIPGNSISLLKNNHFILSSPPSGVLYITMHHYCFSKVVMISTDKTSLLVSPSVDIWICICQTQPKLLQILRHQCCQVLMVSN